MHKAAAQQGVDSENVAKIGESFRDFPDFFREDRIQKSEMQQLQVIQINSKEIGVSKANRNK